jgi:two-component system, chemotaxis family, CheB/CheR fusion protein
MKKSASVNPSPEHSPADAIPVAPDAAEEPERSTPLIAGVGASAGGLEALSALLEALPVDSGMAFVLIQHLDPTHESILTELLSKTTAMSVQEALDGMAVEANHVYVMPPNTNMAILHARLSLMPRITERGQHLPIDYFLRSLADDQQNRAIGVILSGTASDGTQGLTAIKAAGGMTFAQDEQSAKYSGMPHSAAAAGVVDYILPPAAIARELMRIARHPYVAAVTVAAYRTLVESPDDLNKVFIVLRTATGVDFARYKTTTIKRRIARRMMLQQIDQLPVYVRFLQGNPAEVAALYADLLINVTSFFRERETFEGLTEIVWPGVIQDRPPEMPIRIWVPGCSTGEEAYSLTISLLEFLEARSHRATIQIFATDISYTAIETARAGSYGKNIEADVTPERLQRYFVKMKSGYQVSKTIRDQCVFARQDVTKDPPFSKLDLISCRNVLIYLEAETQKRVLPLFHYALNPHGYLLLGNSESIGGFADLFAPGDKRLKVYVKKAPRQRPHPQMTFDGPAAELPGPRRQQPDAHTGLVDVRKEADRILLAKYAPAGVLINADFDILEFRGRTRDYLEPAPGAASLNLLNMAREELTLFLRTAVHQAKKTQAPIHQAAIRVQTPGGVKVVDVEVLPIETSPTTDEWHFLILFVEPAAPLPAAAQPEAQPAEAVDRTDLTTRRLQQELASTREVLRAIIEEKEATNEELRAANEEIQSSNEELQSANEEMQTAREELQSANEELTTVNDELQNRNLELGQANDDLNNLLGIMKTATVILSNDLRIRLFAPAAETLLNLIPSDIGRPLGDLRLTLQIPDLEARIADVIRTLDAREFEAQDQNGRWVAVRIRPYRTADNRIEGAVMTVIDVDTLKRSLLQAQVARAYAEAIVETVHEPLLVLDADLRVKTANRAFYSLFQTTPAEAENHFIYHLGEGQWGIASLRELLEEILHRDMHFENFEVDATFPHAGRKQLILNARRVHGEDGRAQLILLAMEEASGEKRS